MNVSLGDSHEHEEVVARFDFGPSKKRRGTDGASSSRPIAEDNSSSEDEENEIPDYQNLSLLRSYTDHVAARIWQGKVSNL